MVHDVGVMGVQSKELETELPKAYVVPKKDDVPSEEELKMFVKNNLASHKQLRGGVTFVSERPKTASGKSLRKELRRNAADVDVLKTKL